MPSTMQYLKKNLKCRFGSRFFYEYLIMFIEINKLFTIQEIFRRIFLFFETCKNACWLKAGVAGGNSCQSLKNCLKFSIDLRRST